MSAPSSTWFTASPDWGWLIVVYLFFSGLAGGCYLLATITDLAGRPEDRPIARAGYLVVLPCLVVGGIVLIVDLSRPGRFWHLLLENHSLQPMFKHWSPMSTGSWALLAFGFFALLSFLAVLAEDGKIRWPFARRLRPPGAAGAAVSILGALCGLYIAGYTGVMLAVTNRPIWSDTPLVGMLLVTSATSISAAALMLLGRRYRWRAPGVAALERIDTWVIALEVLVVIAFLVSLVPVARAWLSARGLVLATAVIVGMLLPLFLHARRHRFGDSGPALAATLVLLGGFALRAVIVFSSEGLHP